MKRLLFSIPLLAVLLPNTVLAQSAPIQLDGRFSDWTPSLATFTDNNSPASGIDLLSMQVTNDDQYLFIKLVVGTEIDLQSDRIPQTIRLYIDADNNAATGNAAQTGYGAELQVKFDTRTCTQYVPASTSITWSSIDLVSLPTTTGTTFEIAIARNAVPDAIHTLFTSSTIKLLFKESDGGDAMPNSGSTFSYTFDNTAVSPLVPITLARPDPTNVRAVAWNVHNDDISSASLQGQFQRMLAALSPDIIGFAECVSTSAATIKTKLDTWVPIGGTGWHTVKDDYDMVIASRWPITQTWPALDRQFAALIDLPSSYATDLLFTAVHLQCCTADTTRQKQCDAYAQFIHDAKTPGGVITLPPNTPFIQMGDFNMVGYAQQLTTLITGDIVNNTLYGADSPLDWDNTDLTDQLCRQTDARFCYSWRSSGGSYPPGRLDFAIYPDAVMSVAKSFALRTEVMPAATLTQYGLNSTDSGTASDHFPMTADLVIPITNVRISAKVFLEGPFDSNTNLMRDSLRVKALIPTTEPYSALGFTQVIGGGETVAQSVLNITGNNAIVDWVLLELRDKNNSASILSTRCALLQRDGDVVDVDGVSPVTFAHASDQFFVAVRHRNHLGAMTSTAVALSGTSTTIDFANPATSTFGTGALKTIGTVNALRAGNAQRDTQLLYTGANNDRDPILVRIGGTIPTNTVNGYFLEDCTLDGTVKYTGANNDRDPILVNIGGTIPTATRAEQLP